MPLTPLDSPLLESIVAWWLSPGRECWLTPRRWSVRFIRQEPFGNHPDTHLTHSRLLPVCFPRGQPPSGCLHSVVRSGHRKLRPSAAPVGVTIPGVTTSPQPPQSDGSKVAVLWLAWSDRNPSDPPSPSSIAAFLSPPPLSCAAFGLTFRCIPGVQPLYPFWRLCSTCGLALIPTALYALCLLSGEPCALMAPLISLTHLSERRVVCSIGPACPALSLFPID